MPTVQQRADAARRRILEAAIGLSEPPARRVSGRRELHSLKGVALALLGGFLVGYSPAVRAIVIRNADSLLRTLLCPKV
jgi:hypothetical protein